MTQDEIIRFAIQCRLVTTGNRDGLYMDALTEFANLVAAKEREACENICDKAIDFWVKSGFFECAEIMEASKIAEEIKARGEQA